MERRDRLRKMLAGMDEEQAVAALGPPTDQEMAEAAAGSAVPINEVFYTEGTPALRAARQDIAQFSLRRAALRLAAARRAREDPGEDEAGAAAATERTLRILTNQASEIGDERPIAGCAFSPDGSQLATGAWSGTVKVWAMPSLTKQLTIKAHAERVTGVAWHPDASTTGARRESNGSVAVVVGRHGRSSRSLLAGCSRHGCLHAANKHSPSLSPAGRMEATVTLASGATDATAKLWSADGHLLRTLAGHSDRLGRVAFHPMGRHLGEPPELGGRACRAGQLCCRL